MTDFPHPFTAKVVDANGDTREVSDVATFNFPAQDCYVNRAIQQHLNEQGLRVLSIDR